MRYTECNIRNAIYEMRYTECDIQNTIYEMRYTEYDTQNVVHNPEGWTSLPMLETLIMTCNDR